jgi:hypothetical protein
LGEGWSVLEKGRKVVSWEGLVVNVRLEDSLSAKRDEVENCARLRALLEARRVRMLMSDLADMFAMYYGIAERRECC